MKREWKPGDVAMISIEGGDEWTAIRLEDCWHGERTKGSGQVCWRDDVVTARPLVVIDPHDSMAVERLQDLYLAAERKGLSGLSMQAALNEFANPTPKPKEPTGLGAVVEDDRGWHWVRNEYAAAPWRCTKAAGDSEYADIAAVRVLAYGYEPLPQWERDLLEGES